MSKEPKISKQTLIKLFYSVFKGGYNWYVYSTGGNDVYIDFPSSFKKNCSFDARLQLINNFGEYFLEFRKVIRVSIEQQEFDAMFNKAIEMRRQQEQIEMEKTKKIYLNILNKSLESANSNTKNRIVITEKKDLII